MPDDDKQTFDRNFEILYEEYFSYLVNYLSTIIPDFNKAEDIVHDVFIKMYKNRRLPQGDFLKCKNYMIKAARNMAIDHIRKERREEQKFLKSILEWSDDDSLSDVGNIVIEGCIVSTVNDVLSDFPERNRKIFYESMVENRCVKDLSVRDDLSRYRIKRIESEISYVLRERLKVYLK